MAWYCLDNGSWWDQWVGCGTGVLTAQEQQEQMRANFGRNIDPSLANKAVGDFGLYLQETGYDAEIKRLRDSENTNWLLVIGLLVGGLFVVDRVLPR